MEYIKIVLTTISSWLPKLVGVNILLFLSLCLIGYLSRWSKKKLDRSKMDPTLTPFFATMINFSLNNLLFISVAELIEIQTISFILILVGVLLSIGNAFDRSLGSLISGIILLIFKPFRVVDFIETNGVMGTVKEISLFVTILSDRQNRTLIIPNAKMTL
ncbi:MAG: mechanosensitive ion channel domain-containing protein [Flavobacteriales bacterium AspAUS03]